MIREAKPGDEYAIIDLIKELAVYEKEPLSSVKNTPAQLAKDLFNDRICSAYVVQIKDKVVGYAIYYFSYSTWNGVCLYLEDLYVQPEHRDKRIGSTLFDAVVSKAHRECVEDRILILTHVNSVGDGHTHACRTRPCRL